jgi:E3 ubiquitin-protein ligase listerin
LTVPSLVRTWLLDCTDRQLSSSVVSYTSQHFSPVIIRTELAHVKSPEATAELTDENMTIKVAHVVNEVTASYLVDEHQLEITLKMPTDWPLHTIEIKDTKKVGVLEDRWRAWVLGVQQIIWSQVRNAKKWFQNASDSCSFRMGVSWMA